MSYSDGVSRQTENSDGKKSTHEKPLITVTKGENFSRERADLRTFHINFEIYAKNCIYVAQLTTTAYTITSLKRHVLMKTCLASLTFAGVL